MRHRVSLWVVVAAAATGLAGCYSIPLPAPQPPAPVVNAPPTLPISNVSPAAPPIATLPPASAAAPPADRIADPVTAAATCGDWHQQSNYGDRWSTTSTWWEYRCTDSNSIYYPHPCPPVGACDQVCYGYPIDCYTTTEDWADYFVWDGSSSVFYGQRHSFATDDGNGYYDHSTEWWDASSAQWYSLTPAITSFAPAGGAAGTVIDIHGRNFSGATLVTFGGSTYSDGAPAVFTVDSNSEIHATVPDYLSIGNISVTTPDGRGVSASAFAVTASAVSPTMTSFTPAGGTAGTIVDIHGWNFSSATLVTFGGSTYANGVPAVFTVDSNSEIHATVPAGANDGLISVTTPGGTARSAAVFWVTPPSITSFTPTHGPVGTTVVILGSGLSHVTAVSFNGSPALYTIVTDSDVRATVPTGSTSGPISVTTPAGTATSASVFTVG